MSLTQTGWFFLAVLIVLAVGYAMLGSLGAALVLLILAGLSFEGREYLGALLTKLLGPPPGGVDGNSAK